MRLEFTKQLFLLSVKETKNNSPKYQHYIFVDEEVGETITLLGEKKPVQVKRDYEVRLSLTLDKKTLLEDGKKVQYDIGKLFLNEIKMLGE